MADLFEGLPTEIKQTIFNILARQSQNKSLSNALLVSKSWYSQIVPLIWREVTLRSIWFIRNSQNAGVYLPFIHSLVFGLNDSRYHGDIIQVLEQPHLPNLEKISYVPGVILNNNSIDYIVAYLRPSLLAFYCIGGKLSVKLLSALKETCTRLEDLRIKLPSNSIIADMSKDEFQNWLSQIPSLRALSVFNKGSPNAPVVDDIVGQLLSKSTFQKLLKRPFRRLCLEYPVEEIDGFYTGSICHTLRELSMVVKPTVIPGLPDLERLQKLQLRVDGVYSEDVLSPICSLVDLKSLRIIFTKALKLQLNHIMSLKHLVKLEELEIRTAPKVTEVGPVQFIDKTCPPIKILPSFDVEDFDELALSLPKLRHVCLLFDWEPNSCHVLKSAAYLWPEIECLCLGPYIDIHESTLLTTTGSPLFPYLRKLKIRFLFTDVTGNFDFERPIDRLAINQHVDKIVKNLSDAFPALEGIQFYSDPDLQKTITNLVEDIWFPKNRQWNCYRLDWCWEFEEYF